MQDLNATIFYKAKFKIAANDSTIDLLWTLVYDIRSWLLGKWNNENHKRINPDVKIWSRFKSGGRLFDEEKTNLVYGESMKCVYGDEGVVSWACRIVEKIDPKQGFCPREWTTEIGYQSTDKSSAEISYIITFNDIPGYIGLREQVPTFGVPRVIRALLSNEKITCSIGNDQLPCDPIWLNSGDYSSFEKMNRF